MEHKGTKILETNRLILRPAQLSDAKPMYDNWASDPQVTEFLTWSAYQSIENAEQILNIWVSEYENLQFYQWMIVLKDLDQPIGSISVVSVDESVDGMEIGYCIGKAWWHQGIMSEALACVIDYLFDAVGVNRITANHDVRNPRSGSVMLKCGMQYEGTLRQAGRNNQGICDLCVYSVLREEHQNPTDFQ